MIDDAQLKQWARACSVGRKLSTNEGLALIAEVRRLRNALADIADNPVAGGGERRRMARQALGGADLEAQRRAKALNDSKDLTVKYDKGES